MWDPYAEFESATLPNGLKVYAAHWPGRPWERIGFLIHTGAEYDPVGKEGLAHFVEHVVSENGELSAQEIKRYVKALGGSVNLGVTGWHYTNYQLKVPIDAVAVRKSLHMFGRMLISAELKKNVERVRGVIVEEFNRAYPFGFVLELDKAEHRALYTGWWLERTTRPLGTLSSIRGISQVGLQNFYDTHYNPTNMSVVGVGGMKLEDLVVSLLESPFALEKPGRRTPLVSPVSSLPKPLEIRREFVISDYVNSEVNAGGYRSVARIPGTVGNQVIRLVSDMLDESLFEEVRERRSWTYDIRSGYNNFRYFHEFHITCGHLSSGAIDVIEDAVETCLDRVREKEDLFDQCKQRAIARIGMLDPNGRGICDGALSDLDMKQRIVSLSEDLANVEDVRMEDVRGVCEFLRPDWRWTLLKRP